LPATDHRGRQARPRDDRAGREASRGSAGVRRRKVCVMASRRYVIVTPVRDEAEFIGKTIAAVSSQTVLPTRWIVVDDGSTDGTWEILERHASQTSWMSVVRRADRGHRAAGGGVVEAFYAGYALLNDELWDYLVKLDGDLSFAPDYFERCF